MKLQRLAAAGAALGLAMAPVIAQAQQAASPAGKLSLSRPASADQVKRAGAPVAKTSNLTGAATAGFIFGALAIGFIIWAVADGDNKPSSP